MKTVKIREFCEQGNIIIYSGDWSYIRQENMLQIVLKSYVICRGREKKIMDVKCWLDLKGAKKISENSAKKLNIIIYSWGLELQ